MEVKVSIGKFSLRRRGRNLGVQMRSSVCVCVCARVPLRSGSLKNTKDLQPLDTLNRKSHKCDGIPRFGPIKQTFEAQCQSILQIVVKNQTNSYETQNTNTNIYNTIY